MRAEFFEHTALFGSHPGTGLVAVEYGEREGEGHIDRFERAAGGGVTCNSEPFHPYLWLADPAPVKDHDAVLAIDRLKGGGPLLHRVTTRCMKDLQAVLALLRKETGKARTAPEAPYFCISDPVQQYLMESGRTLFKGMEFGQLRRMQVDIETYTTPGYDFSNADREEDRIIAIALADGDGWCEVLDGSEQDEKTLLQRFCARVAERDPDVLEGHNIFNFDLPYIAARARRHRVKLALGRDGSPPVFRNSRFSAAERTLTYERCELHGRHVIDTYFLAQLYDVSQRSLGGYGLKEVARHFGLAPEDRTYLEGHDIARTFREQPEVVMRYARDDIIETGRVAALLSPVYFTQTQMLPMTYQNTALRGTATKIDALLLREYLRQGHAVACPDPARSFAGGYTDIFITGIRHNVHHCDIQSLYPSLMLKHRLEPRSDDLHVFLELLDALRTFRIKAKREMRAAGDRAVRDAFNALQSAFKILINSFYGYLGFGQARFSDFDQAEKVAAEGRQLLQQMVDWLRENGAQPIEIDTDGIYFVPPDYRDEAEQERFEAALQAALPEGIEVEFDGRYRAMFSYKMKNYALLDEEGELTLRGAALKSRGLEPFQRDFMVDLLRCLLEGRAAGAPALKARYEKAIRDRAWPIQRLAKTETLQEAPATYAAKIEGKSRGRSAAYELALAAERNYRAGDQIAYYVTGDRKNVAVHSAARLVADWEADARDENVPYYLAKLDALYAKFAEWIPEEDRQQRLF